MLLQQPDISQEQMDIIQSLYSVSSRMTRLNKNLLLLARIDNDQYLHMEDIDFVQTLYAQLLYLRERAESNEIKVNVEIENPLNIHANRILVESLITNLIVNAIRYNTENGTINMRVVDGGFVISNTGAAQALDKERCSDVLTVHRKKRKATDWVYPSFTKYARCTVGTFSTITKIIYILLLFSLYNKIIQV